ncbi:MAG: hypothetical protein ACR2RV_02170 [Verrucomicrobiales bacterium]
MLKDFPLHEPDTAPPASAALLDRTQEAFGMIPNLERSMATAPALLEAYGALWDLFESTSFSPAERQIIYQTINVEHQCTY